MGRIGSKTAAIPEGVAVTQDGNNITVKGPRGELTRTFSVDIKMNIGGNEVTFTRPNDSKEMKAVHGTTRTNFSNMVVGASEGFRKALELIGVGYRTQLQGPKLVLNVGCSHPVKVTPPAGATVEVPASIQVVVKGVNKKEVGGLAANIHGTRPPEPYEGKGIRYIDEYIRRKEGKTDK